MLSTLDIVILGSYLGLLIFCGFWYHLNTRKSTELIDGGRNLPGWAVGLSLLGTGLSSIALFSFPALAYAGDWTYFVDWIPFLLAAYIASRFYVAYFRKTGHISAYAHFRERIGPWAAVYAAFTFIAYQTVRIGLIMFLVSQALSVLMDWDFRTITVITGIVVTAYTYLGGIRAVIATDVLQSLLLALGVVFLVAFIVGQTPHTLGEIIEIANEHNKFDCVNNAWSLTEKSFLVLFIGGLINGLRWYSTDQACIQRYIVSKSSSAARTAVWVEAITSPLVSAILFFAGTALFVFYQTQPELLAAFQDNPNVADRNILAYFILTEMPSGLTGLMVTVILAAAMSTLDTVMNSTATLVLKEIVEPIHGRELSEKPARRVLASSAIIQGAIAIWIGMQFAEIENVYEVFIEIMSMFTGCLLGLFLLVYTYKKPGGFISFLSLTAGVLAIIFVRNFTHLDGLLAGAIATATIFATGSLLQALNKQAHA